MTLKLDFNSKLSKINLELSFMDLRDFFPNEWDEEGFANSKSPFAK